MGWVSCYSRVLQLPWMVRAMSTATSRDQHFLGMHSDARKVVSSCISAVSPAELVSNTLRFDTLSSTLSVAQHKYKVNNNVKVVACGKAVLSMARAVERILGPHITEGVVSVPTGSTEMAQRNCSHQLLAHDSRMRIYEGAAGNLPDSASEAAAREALGVARRCGQDDILLVLISGGGSALLPCPAEGISLEEKRKVVESLAKAGAGIQEVNTLRKAISQTKGGRLAEAAAPAKVLGLILSDIVGDPLDLIASGPTVPQQIDNRAALNILDKYRLQDMHSSVSDYLRSQPPQRGVSESYGRDHVLNLVIGNNKLATAGAKAAAINQGYTSYVWSHQLQGEASFLGQVYAAIALYISLRRHSDADLTSARENMYECLDKLTQLQPVLEMDALNLKRSVEMVRPDTGGFCLIGGGEPTVTVRGAGQGGRNQELALSFVITLHKLQTLHNPAPIAKENCVFVSVGTDGQDGACDAAGAVVDPSLFSTAREQGLDPTESLLDNDSYSFFSALNSGGNLLKTGLTGTNVMDVHVLLMK